MDIESFIDTFRRDFSANAEAQRLLENHFTNGYCYHFACIMENLFEGSIVYNDVDNHFAFMVGDFDGDFTIYDITGKIDKADGCWEKWELYQVKEPIASERIIEQCCYKFYMR